MKLACYAFGKVGSLPICDLSWSVVGGSVCVEVVITVSGLGGIVLGGLVGKAADTLGEDDGGTGKAVVVVDGIGDALDEDSDELDEADADGSDDVVDEDADELFRLASGFGLDGDVVTDTMVDLDGMGSVCARVSVLGSEEDEGDLCNGSV